MEQHYHGNSKLDKSDVDPELVIEEFSVGIEFRTSTFFTVFSIIKLVFVLFSIISFCCYYRVIRQFSRDDLGIV